MTTLDLATDMDLMDGLSTVNLVARGVTDEVNCITALRRDISIREAAASDGRYLMRDVRFHWQIDPDRPTTIPAVGDAIVDDDGTWTILEVGKKTLNSRWACVCRNLSIVAGLDTLITIQSAAWAKDANGSQVATWTDLATNVPAKIQRIAASEQSGDNHRQNQARYEVYTTSILILGKNHRLIGSDATMYRVTGYTNPERIDQLTTIQCEEWVQ